MKACAAPAISALVQSSRSAAQQLLLGGVIPEVCRARKLHRDRRNDIQGLGTLFSNHIPDYRNLMNSYAQLTQRK